MGLSSYSLHTSWSAAEVPGKVVPVSRLAGSIWYPLRSSVLGMVGGGSDALLRRTHR
jgi:hypothetical protein